MMELIVVLVQLISSLLTLEQATASDGVFGVKKGLKIGVYWKSFLEFQPLMGENCYQGEGYRKKPNFYDFLSLSEDFDTITIAFADQDVERCHRKGLFCPYNQIVCGIDIYDDQEGLKLFKDLKDAISLVRGKGTKVILAFGGQEFGNLRVPFGTTRMADRVVEHVLTSAEKLVLDGVDLVQAEGCGEGNLRCGDATAEHLYLIEKLRTRLGSEVSLSYTFPSGGPTARVNYPFWNVVKYAHPFLDGITLYGSLTTHNQIRQVIGDTDIPKRKLTWGFPISNCGEGDDADTAQEGPTPLSSLKDVATVADKARNLTIGGLAAWPSYSNRHC